MIFFKKDLKPDKYFIDSTGFSIIRKWYKLHKLCNSKGEIAFAITEGDVNDSSLFEDFIEHILAALPFMEIKHIFQERIIILLKRKE